MNLKKLPIGIQTFKKIVEGDYLYVDKTRYALELIENYEYVFLSRPRRFGKSLFLDTLNEIFKGNGRLFKGLYIYGRYDFEFFPVIRIDFRTITSTGDLLNDLNIEMRRNQGRLGVECESKDYASCFEEIIYKAYKKYKRRVVILIDEYDKPILDMIGNLGVAIRHRDILRRLYSQIKASDRYIRFVFLTGVSKFARASIFSGLNNIEDISLNADYGDICGYTNEEMEIYFNDYMRDIDKDKVKMWYNGYNFLGSELYNPFDILKYIKNKYVLKNYWWESGSFYSLISLLKDRSFYLPELENCRSDDMLINSFDIEDIRIESLLFQAGYLTIREVIQKRNKVEYVLKVPNMEVQVSLNELIIRYMTGDVNSEVEDNIWESLREGDVNRFRDILFSMYASIPYNNYVNNSIMKVEGYWSSIAYAYLSGSGFRVISEDVSNRGRVDITIIVGDKAYVIEFKVVVKEGVGNEALRQIKERRYYEKYMSRYDTFIIGIVFSEKERNIVRFDWERI